MGEDGTDLAPHVSGGEPREYRIVIPTRGRWRPALQIAKHERILREETRPFILVKTLGFLKRQKISPSVVSLWTADEEEKSRYEHALSQDEYWRGVEICVGTSGILNQRNHIAKTLPEGLYVVSLDDDVAEVHWKRYAGNVMKALETLPAGAFESLIFHAHDLMVRYRSFIWGLATTSSMNIRCMWTDGVSTRNGEINGFLYGFLNRHDPALMPVLADATEDAERSLRYFAKDKILLRYRMYCVETRCFQFGGGLQDLFLGESISAKNQARKVAEKEAAAKLHSMFPSQTTPPKSKVGCSTLEVGFKSIGGPVVPTSTVSALRSANASESAMRKGRPGRPVPNAKKETKEPHHAKEETKEPDHDKEETERPDHDEVEAEGSEHGKGETDRPDHDKVMVPLLWTPPEKDRGATAIEASVLQEPSSVMPLPRSRGDSPELDLEKSRGVTRRRRRRVSRSPSTPENASPTPAVPVQDGSHNGRIEDGIAQDAGPEPLVAKPSEPVATVDAAETVQLSVDDEDDVQEGEDENAQLEAVMGVPPDAPPAGVNREAEEAEMVRRAIEASMDDLVIRINGDVANALEKALEQSKALEATERRQREVESRDLAKAREMSRLEAGILDSDSEDEGARCARPSVGVVRHHPVAIEELVDMGFAPEAAARALRDAAGDVATAAVMLTGPPTKRPRHEKEPVDLEVQSAPRQTLGSLPESIMSLIEMGFNEAVAVQALSDAGGDLSVAAAMLLSTAKA